MGNGRKDAGKQNSGLQSMGIFHFSVFYPAYEVELKTLRAKRLCISSSALVLPRDLTTSYKSDLWKNREVATLFAVSGS